MFPTAYAVGYTDFAAPRLSFEHFVSDPYAVGHIVSAPRLGVEET
jgi:hypothetical protein